MEDPRGAVRTAGVVRVAMSAGLQARVQASLRVVCVEMNGEGRIKVV